MGRLLWLPSVAATLIWAGSGTAHAQAAEPNRTDANAGQDSEIIVTALKQRQPLARTAAPVSVIDGESVRIEQITSADRLAEFATSLTVLPNVTGNLLFIRGVGNFTLTANSEPAVGWNYDGVFVAKPIATAGQFFDLARIELLKGPQGVLYGRNASAGTVTLIPARPDPKETSAFASVSYGSYDALNAEAFANLPIGRDGAIRVSGQALDQQNFQRGYDSGLRQFSGRVQLLAHPIEALTIRVSGDVSGQNGIGLGTTYLGYYLFDPAAARYRFTASGLDPAAGIYSLEAQAFRRTVPLVPLGRTIDALQSRPRQNNEFYGAHAEVTADIGGTTLTILPAWRFNDIDQIAPGAPFGYRQLETQDQRSLEVRLAGRAGKVEWLGGMFLFDENVALRYALNFSLQLAVQDQRYTTKSRALFANVKVELAPGFRIGGGIRQTWDRKRFGGTTSSFTLVCQTRVAGRPSCPTVPLLQLGDDPSSAGLPVPVAGGPIVPIFVNGTPTGASIARNDRSDDLGLKNTATTWRLSGEADLGRLALAYATVENGYRPGGLNAATGFEVYNPETITAYTLGARRGNGSDRFRVAAELFWWDYRNQQVSSVQPDLSTPPRNVNLTRNVARSRIRGIDLAVTVRPTWSSYVSAEMQYLDSEYRDFTYVQANTGAPPLTGCSTTFSAATNLYTVDCGGQRPFASPKWTLGLIARQEFALGRLRLSMMARTRYVTAQNAGAAFLAEQVIPGHWTSDAQVSLSGPNRSFQVAAFVRNIEGDRTPTFVIFHPVTNLVVASISPPRVWGVRIAAQF